MSANKVNLRLEINKTLLSKERYGESKYEAKRTGANKSYIYSYSTARAYKTACQKFANYVIEKEGSTRISLDIASRYLNSFLSDEIAKGLSPYTLKLERSALAKLYDINGEDIIDLPKRSRADIRRSRERSIISEVTGKPILNPSSRAGHFSEKKNHEIVDFCRSTGLRRSELKQLRTDQLRRDGERLYIDLKGHQCKGGRSRELLVIGDVQNVIDCFSRAIDSGFDRVFERIPSAMDVHHYRSVYATDLYNAIARPVNEIPKNERYYCRGDLKGVIYDKAAMVIVTEALGHSRISVIAGHYLR